MGNWSSVNERQGNFNIHCHFSRFELRESVKQRLVTFREFSYLPRRLGQCCLFWPMHFSDVFYLFIWENWLTDRRLLNPKVALLSSFHKKKKKKKRNGKTKQDIHQIFPWTKGMHLQNNCKPTNQDTLMICIGACTGAVGLVISWWYIKSTKCSLLTCKLCQLLQICQGKPNKCAMFD